MGSSIYYQDPSTYVDINRIVDIVKHCIQKLEVVPDLTVEFFWNGTWAFGVRLEHPNLWGEALIWDHKTYDMHIFPVTGVGAKAKSGNYESLDEIESLLDFVIQPYLNLRGNKE